MKVTLQYFAALRECAGRDEEEIETAAATARELYQELQKRYRLPYALRDIKVAINERFSHHDASLAQGDRIVFIQPIAGG